MGNRRQKYILELFLKIGLKKFLLLGDVNKQKNVDADI
jgi:hypothetical protein